MIRKEPLELGVNKIRLGPNQEPKEPRRDKREPAYDPVEHFEVDSKAYLYANKESDQKPRQQQNASDKGGYLYSLYQQVMKESTKEEKAFL